MTRDEIIRMAKEADAANDNVSVTPFLERFAALVAAAEREACAQVCEASASRLFGGKSRVNQVDRHTADVLRRQAEAIRAMGQS